MKKSIVFSAVFLALVISVPVFATPVLAAPRLKIAINLPFLRRLKVLVWSVPVWSVPVRLTARCA
jgi:hypothetical protein